MANTEYNRPFGDDPSNLVPQSALVSQGGPAGMQEWKARVFEGLDFID